MSEVAKRKSIEIFCCYARKDEALLDELRKHVKPLQREGLITLRADIDIGAGAEWEQEIHRYLNTAQIILLLISPDFLASDYCYSDEMERALERHERGEARVISIILRTCSWQKTPLGKLQALPKDAKPITRWPDQDEAFNDVSERLREAVEAILAEEEQRRKEEEAERQREAEKERLRKVEEERQRKAEKERLHSLEVQVKSKPSTSFQSQQVFARSSIPATGTQHQQSIIHSRDDQSASNNSSSPEPYQQQPKKQIAAKNATEKLAIVTLSSFALFFITGIIFAIVGALGQIWWISLFFLVLGFITGIVMAYTYEKQRRK